MRSTTTLCLTLILKSVLFLSFNYNAVAQTKGQRNETEIKANNGDLFRQDILTTLTYEGIAPFSPPTNLEGSVYLDESFVNSRVITKDSSRVIKNIALRYNIFNDAMEFSQKDQIQSFFINKIKSVNLGGDIFMVVHFEQENKKNKLKYMKTLDLENPLALENYEIEIKEPYYRAGVHNEKPNPQVVVKTTLYANLPNQEKIIAIRKKADLYNLVGNKAKEIKEYLKKNKLSVNSLDDLQKILSYYVSLKN